jgi:hypothetical protein
MSMNRFLILAAAAGILALLNSCTPQQAQDAGRYQADIAAACGVAMTLAPIAGPYAPWIVGACGSEALIARLALDPSSLEWLNGLMARVRQG